MAFCTNCGAQTPEGSGYCANCGSRLGAPVLPPNPPPVQQYGTPPPGPVYTPSFAPGMVFAPWTDRVIGHLIDIVIVFAVMGILYPLLGTFLALIGGGFGTHPDPFGSGICCIFILLFPISTFVVGLYNGVYLVSSRGASIGQGVMKLKTVDANGNLLSTGTAFLRLLMRVLLSIIAVIWILDGLWPLFDDRRQTLHDKVVGSFVLKQA